MKTGFRVQGPQKVRLQLFSLILSLLPIMIQCTVENSIQCVPCIDESKYLKKVINCLFNSQKVMGGNGIAIFATLL